VNKTRAISQISANIQAKAQANVTVTYAKASADALIATNVGQVNITKDIYGYNAKALKYVNDKLSFKSSQASLLQYFYYSRIDNLKKDTGNKLVLGKIYTSVSLAGGVDA
jgi:hypothetical protein